MGLGFILGVLLIFFVVVFFSMSKGDEQKNKQLNCKHDFKYVQDVFGYGGDVLMHQYECTHCGRKDYLVAILDKDKDWNHGVGDGTICDIDNQDYISN